MLVYSELYGLGDFITYGAPSMFGRNWTEYVLVRWDNTTEESYINLSKVEIYTSWYDYICAM